MSANFAHAPGERIGDLVFVAELDRVIDFRLGTTLRELTLTRAFAPNTSRESLRDAAGVEISDLAGRPIALYFTTPGPEREVLSATLELPGGGFTPLIEGSSLTVP